MTLSRALFTTGTDDWTTPPALFAALDAEFSFDVDLAASPANALCARYYTAEDSALTAPAWRQPDVTVGFCNPPYSRGLQRQFIARAAAERAAGFTTVLLLPARTDTRAFHEHLYDARHWRARAGVELRFLPGRLRFGGAAQGAPFPSMLAILREHTDNDDTRGPS